MMRTAMRTPSVKLLIERDKQSRPLSPSKVPPTVPQRSPQTTLTHPDKTKKPTLIGTNTKRISRKLYIQLMKGEFPDIRDTLHAVFPNQRSFESNPCACFNHNLQQEYLPNSFFLI